VAAVVAALSLMRGLTLPGTRRGAVANKFDSSFGRGAEALRDIGGRWLPVGEGELIAHWHGVDSVDRRAGQAFSTPRGRPMAGSWPTGDPSASFARSPRARGQVPFFLLPCSRVAFGMACMASPRARRPAGGALVFSKRHLRPFPAAANLRFVYARGERGGGGARVSFPTEKGRAWQGSLPPSMPFSPLL
jgi:hypothetical protein